MIRPAQPTTSRVRALAIPVVAGLVLMIYAALGLVYWQQRSQQGSIQGQLTQLSRVVDQPREGLEGLKAQVEEARALIPEELKDTEVYPAIRQLAADSGVAVKSVTAHEGTKGKIGDTMYRVMPFTIQVGGEGVTYQEVVGFIARLETQQRLPTLFIDKASVSQSEGQASASVDFRLYVQPEPQKKATPTPTPTPKP